MKNSYLYRLTLLFALFSALAVFAQAPDPAGWWKFDDPADLLKPEAGFGLPLELVGTHQSVDGPAAGNGAVVGHNVDRTGTVCGIPDLPGGVDNSLIDFTSTLPALRARALRWQPPSVPTPWIWIRSRSTPPWKPTPLP